MDKNGNVYKDMSEPITVKVNKRYQIAVPAAVRDRLNMHSGDRLLVDIQDGMIVLLPQPADYTGHLSGLYQKIWEGVDSESYLRGEREGWR